MAIEASRTADTDFGRAALRDGVVSRAEYEESITRMVDCGKAKGQVIDATLRYGLYVFSAAGREGDAVFQECSKGDLGTIQAVYFGQYTDPQGRGRIVTSECLVKNGVLPDTYRFDAARFDSDVNKLLKTAAESSPVRQVYEMCMYNPLGR